MAKEPLTEDGKKRLDDIALGLLITNRIPTDDQIAALREQAVANAAKAKADLVPKLQELVTVVDDEKKKKDKTKVI